MRHLGSGWSYGNRDVCPGDDSGEGGKQMSTTKRDPGTAVSAETLQCWADMRAEFFEEYQHSGLISVESMFGIHLTEESFLATFDHYKTTVLKHSEYPEQLDAMFNKARFFCVRKESGNDKD
jgi:hypothetical protein